MLQSLAAQSLFWPLADLLTRLPGDALPDHGALDALLAEAAPGAASGGGRPVRFVPPPQSEDMGYEARIYREGAVPTRADNWHDFFNALVWCAFPRAKAAMNTRHWQEMADRAAAALPGRGPVRDALTQFDECGVLVLSSDPELPELLRRHRWEEAFWERREDMGRRLRFLVFGHATYDFLRSPFFGLCAKAVYLPVSAEWLALPPVAQRAKVDGWLAGRLADPASFLGPREFFPLPLLGIPGLTPDNEAADYYRDGRQFRPQRCPQALAGGHAGMGGGQ